MVIFLEAAKYLMSLKTNTALSTTQRKTFILGFITCIKSTISMANQMFHASIPFNYLLTYKFSQDHIELLYSCIRSRGGWNNNPKCLQFKYALRKMLLRNEISASKQANCVDFTGCNLIPLFHIRKHKANETDKQTASMRESTEILSICQHLDKQGHSELISSVLFYISGYIVSKLIDDLPCPECKRSLNPEPIQPRLNGHDYMANTSHEPGKAASFTTFVNKGGLQMPSRSVFRAVEYCEHVFRAAVAGKDGQLINGEKNIKMKMIVNVGYHFALETTEHLFTEHEYGNNEVLVEDDHRTQILKYVAKKYFTLRLFHFGETYCKDVLNHGKQSDRHRLNKVTPFRCQ